MGTQGEILEQQNAVSAAEIPTETSGRLPDNAVNLWFYLLIEAFRDGDERLAGLAYGNLKRIAMAYLNKFHRPLFTVSWEPSPGCKPPSSYWDEVLHDTLFGNGLRRKGLIDRYLRISSKENWRNALLNRYSGFLTHLRYRHIDLWENDRREHPLLVRIESASGSKFVGADCGEGEGIELWDNQDVFDRPFIAFDEGGLDPYCGLVPDSATYAEMQPDPRCGRPELGSGEATEALFHQPIALAEWTEANEDAIEREVGETAKWTWKIIAEALIGREMILDHLTEAETRKELLDLLLRVEGIGRPAAAKRLRQLGKSKTLHDYLMGESQNHAGFPSELPRLISVGRSQRKKAGSDGFRAPDRGCASSLARAE